jgi:biotin carboxyl carrier protein
MKIKFQNHIYSIDSKLENGNLSSKLNDETITIPAVKIDENTFTVSNSGSKEHIYFYKEKNHIFSFHNGEHFKFEEIDEEAAGFELETKNENLDEIVPPMPGNIVKIFVKEGDSVKENTPLIIVEAMKMETTLYSSIDGIVKAVNVSEKEQVDTDKVLIVVEKEIV